MIELWPHQERTAEFTFQYMAEHIRGRLLIVIPPGGGKTAIAAHVLRVAAAEQGLRGLAWAHRRELIGQMYDHLVESGIPAEMISVVMAGDPRENPSAPIQVASVDTLRHRGKPLADIVVSDEAHRDASDGRRKLRTLYPDAFHLGFTGTPIRLDGRGLRDDYDEMFIGAQPSELIADGRIVAPKIFTVPPELLPDLKGVKKRGGDFQGSELEKRSNKRALIGGIVDHWIRRAEGRRTWVFPVGIEHSKAIVKRFKAAGIGAAHLDGATSLADRARMLAAFREGALPIISSCGVLSEGIDEPSVKCIVLARATESLSLLIQWCGRCERSWSDVVPIVLDHAGNIIGRKHGSPCMDRPWSLDSTRESLTTRSAPMKACPSCHAVIAAGWKTCPECLAELAAAAEPAEKAGDLVEFRANFTAEEKRRELDRLRQFAAQRKFREGWAEDVYKAKFGEAA